MNQHVDALRTLCRDSDNRVSPYLLRTRFERHLFGLMVTVSRQTFGSDPKGMTESHVLEFVSRFPTHDREKQILISIAKLFAKFTYLCDTSNWSDDGQDPRVELCRDDILRLCTLVDPLTADPARRPTATVIGVPS